jgi:hypothetical protein
MNPQPNLESLWESVERKQKQRAEMMPDEEAAIRLMFEAYIRLKELGWNDICYANKSQGSVNVITPGCTGTGPARFMEPCWWAEEAGDLWPCHPILFKKSED